MNGTVVSGRMPGNQIPGKGIAGQVLFGRLLTGLFLLLLATAAPAQTLTVTISGIRTTEGVVRVSLFTNQADFDREAPRYEKVLSKTGMKNGKLILMLTDLPPGTYGIAVLDDTDGNGNMTYRWWKPAEGYGFSNFTPGRMRKPKFAEFQFSFGSIDLPVAVEMLYW